MKNSFKVLAWFTVMLTLSMAQDIRIFTVDNEAGKITAKSVEKAFKDAGFHITGNNDMNKAFDGKFKTHTHDAYNLFTVHKKEVASKLIKDFPKMALFTPLSMSIFTRKGEKTLSISSMDIAGIAKITGIPTDNADLVAYMKEVGKVFTKAFPKGKFETLSYTIGKAEGALVNTFTIEMDVEGDDNIEDEVDGIQEELEAGLITAGFVVAGYNKLSADYGVKGRTYDFFDAYSICKLSVIFEVSKTHPEAGAFAPCTLFMYRKSGEKVVHFSYPAIYNWFSSIDVAEKASKDVLIKAQKDMNAVLDEVTED
ncbi:hypothetical protein MNB_SV-13-1750 [hydrothermal vent metagenome]|uniref:DUF302 domain-containing protein n=1 Tax=hydrothermal vent metagenome TaxID=652676 RepID=A0A1W1CIF7_9ZZZZ